MPVQGIRPNKKDYVSMTPCFQFREEGWRNGGIIEFIMRWALTALGALLDNSFEDSEERE